MFMQTQKLLQEVNEYMAMPEAKPDRDNNGASPMPKPKPPTTYSPLCKTKNVAAHFGRCKTTLGQQARLLSSPPSFQSPISSLSFPLFPLSLPSPCTLSLLAIKRSTSRHIAAYVNASWAAFHVHVPNESSTFGRDRRTDSMRRETGGGGGRGGTNLAASTRSNSRQTPK